MLKQKVETYNITSPKKAGGKDDMQQINDIIAMLNSDGKRVLNINFGLGQNIVILYEYDD